ncbi:hypothetical protein F5J12DRAFT_785061 [Pisolithus orientalis]|uniref:uncharacterized protein n=1 Tax=Pisolithus orientalis TaxID=936130 RepID=UPI00222497A5|nr:uncharacterized protein F5J12DRAFT_785061 [Pisolithus orientalis]KAI5997846.1 hypothetical protein F5J12DRAFT_785061 [Pisolithus orientalis]
MTLWICTPGFFETTKSPPQRWPLHQRSKKTSPSPGTQYNCLKDGKNICSVSTDRRRSLTPSVSVSSQNSTTPILQEDQVKGAPMEEDAGEAEAKEVEVNIQADEGSQCPDDGASQLLDDEVPNGLKLGALDPHESCQMRTVLNHHFLHLCHQLKTPVLMPRMSFPPHCPGHCVEHKPKSKGKSRAMDVDNSDINTKFKKTGNLSCAALDEIHDSVAKVKAKAEELGCRHGKSPHDILVAAGLSVKPSHTKLNEANLFCLWYWATQPKPDGVNNIITVEYNQLMKDIPKDDTAARKEKLKAVYECSKSSSAVPTNKSVKSIAVRVHNAKMQFSRLYINDCAIDVWGLMNKYTAIFKGECFCQFSCGIGVALLNEGDAKRLQLLGIWIYDKGEVDNVTHGVKVGDPQKIIWQWLLEFVRRNSLIIINWLLGVPPPGPGFEYKKLKADTLHQLVVPYLQRKLGSMYNGQSDDDDDKKNDHLDGVLEVKIKPWNEDVISIGDAHPLKGEIALVKAPDGTVLCKVSDDPEWQKSHEEGDPGMVAPHALSRILFPSHKWPCVEVMDNDTVPHEASHSDHQMPLHEKGRDACPITGDHGVVVYPAAFWSKLTGDMHRMHFMTHQHTQAARTLESLVNLSAPCQLSAMGTLALLSSFHYLDIMRTLIMTVPTIMILAPPMFPTIFSIAQPTAQQWVDRGSAAQYEDEFPEDYLDY